MVLGKRSFVYQAPNDLYAAKQSCMFRVTAISRSYKMAQGLEENERPSEDGLLHDALP